MASRSGHARSVAACMMLAATLATCLSGAAAQDYVDDGQLPTNLLAGGAGIATNADESLAVKQMMRAMLEVAEEVSTGVEQPALASAMAMPADLTKVNASSLEAKVFASALASWQLGVWNAPSNRGLRAKKMNFYDREHYYQVPDNPIGTLVMFHGCYHDASGSWPYDPVHCPECLGLPEEVAHTKQALKHGFAVLAVESRNRSRNGRCFNSEPDPLKSDQWEAPYIVQNFLYQEGLQNLPVYTLGISAGAAFATKVVKNFYEQNFGGIIKPRGIISEVNAPASWRSWGLDDINGKLKYPDFPPVAFISMDRDNRTLQRIKDRIKDLTARGIPADYISVKSRPIDRLFFYDRSPVISARQSAAIVKAMQELGFIDADGNLLYDPRIGDITKGNPLTMWNEKLVKKLPWLHMNPKLPPMLSVLSDRSSIFEEMNVAFAYHEGLADHLVACLVWLRSNGKYNLKQLAKTLSKQKLRDITMRRVYWSPPPPRPKPSPSRPKPSPSRPKPSPSRPKPSPPRPRPRPPPKSASRKARL